MSEPTDYIGHFETTDIGGGDFQSITAITQGTFADEVVWGGNLHPENIADLEQEYERQRGVAETVPHATVEPEVEVPMLPQPPKRTRKR